MRARPNLSEEIRSVVRQRIVDGQLAADSRINEVRLAKELEVSRTPLREALGALVAEGALISIPRRGFFVRPLSAEELRDIYPLRAILDVEAFRLCGLPSKGRLGRLMELNRQMAAAEDVEERIRLDDAWHFELIAECPNQVMLDLIRQFAQRTRRYELAYFRDRQHLRIATADHEEVMRAARERDMEAAVTALRRNLTNGLQPILDWLAQAPRPEGKR